MKTVAKSPPARSPAAKRLALALACLVTTHVGAVRAENYVVDPSHTSVIFGISHLGYSYTYGRFNSVRGGFALDMANPTGSHFQFAIDAASIDTNDQKRDDHLRGPDFFNAKQFPVINFQSSRVMPQRTAKGTTFQVTGNLTIHGVTRQVQLNVQKLGEGKGLEGEYRSGFLCQHSIKRSDYGMTGMIPMIGDEVAITISFEGVRQGPAGSGSGAVGASGTTGTAPAAGSATQQGSGAQGSGAQGSGSGTQGSSGRR